MLATRKGVHGDIINLLLKSKPDLFVVDCSGKSALDWARMVGNQGAIDVLEKAISAFIDAKREDTFAKADAMDVEILSLNDEYTQYVVSALKRQSLAEVCKLERMAD